MEPIQAARLAPLSHERRGQVLARRLRSLETAVSLGPGPREWPRASPLEGTIVDGRFGRLGWL